MKGEVYHYSLRGKRKDPQAASSSSSLPSSTSSRTNANNNNGNNSNINRLPKSNSSYKQRKSNSFGFDRLIKAARKMPDNNFIIPFEYLDGPASNLPCTVNCAGLDGMDKNGSDRIKIESNQASTNRNSQNAIKRETLSLLCDSGKRKSLLGKINSTSSNSIDGESQHSTVLSSSATVTEIVDDNKQSDELSESVQDNSMISSEILDAHSQSSSLNQSISKELDEPLSLPCKTLPLVNNENLLTFNMLQSVDHSPVQRIFTFPSSNTEIEFIVLIQYAAISVWWPEKNDQDSSSSSSSPLSLSVSWKHISYSLDDHVKNLKSSVLEAFHHIWILLAFENSKDLILVHFKFDKYDKTINISLKEFFTLNGCHENEKIINICCIDSDKSALTVPGPQRYSIDLFLYDLTTSTKNLLTSINLNLIHSITVLPISDWRNSLFTLINNQICIWDILKKSLISTIFVENSLITAKLCCDVMYDKGLVYLFIANVSCCAIEVIALNHRTQKYATLVKCNIIDQNNDVTSISTDKSADCHVPINNINSNNLKVNVFKRFGDQVAILTDSQVLLFDLVENKLIHRSELLLHSINDISLCKIANKSVILLASKEGSIFTKIKNE